MASRGDELNTRLTATDDASKVIDKVADKVGDLEDRPHEVDLTGDTDQVERELSALDRRLAGLTDREKQVVLKLAARDAERDLDRINRDLARADRYDDDEIAIRITAKGDAERKLDAIQSEIRDLDGASPKIRPEVDGSELDAFIDKLEEVTGFGGLGRLRGAGGAAGLGAAIAGGFVLAGDAAADAAIDIDNVAKLTGDSVEFASRLAGVMGRAGVETKDLQDILLQMGGVLQDDAELAERLGINLDDGRTLGERFVQVVELLGDRFTDTSERSLVASRLFGEEGVRQVNAVTAAYEDLGQAVDEYNGKIFTQEDAEKAREYKRALAEVRSEFELIALEIGGQAVPALGEFLQALQDIDDFVSTNGGPGLFDQIGAVLSNPFNPATAVINELERAGEKGEEAAARTRQAFERELPDVAARIRDIFDGLNPPTEAVATSFDLVNREIELAIQNVERFGTDGVEQMGKLEEATRDALDPFAELQEKLDSEKTFDRLAEALERVKAAPGDREETRRLLELVLDLGRAYDDIPPETITKIFAQADRGQIDQVFNELQALADQRGIRLQVSTGGTSFRINPGSAPTQVQTPTQFSATPSTVINHFQISPTTGQVVGATSANDFANGTRNSYR